MSARSFSKEAESIISLSIAKKNPSIFTNFYLESPQGGVAVYPGSIRYAQYLPYWESLGKPKNFTVEASGVTFSVEPRQTEEEGLIFFEKRGYIFLPWVQEMWQAPQEQKTVIGVTGTGKTNGIGLLAMYACATIPDFRFLNIAPLKRQADLMVGACRDYTRGTRFRDTFLLPGKKGYVERPHSLFRFSNGSTAEFMNVEKNADNIQGWSGDWINIDEAGLLNGMNEFGEVDLSNIMVGVATRLRGTRPDGKPRAGMLSLISMAYDNDVMWNLYDYGSDPDLSKTYYSRTVLHKENPYLTPKDIERTKRSVPAGQEDSWLEGKRPPKRGALFSGNILNSTFSSYQFENRPEDTRVDINKPGITTYIEPYKPGHIYLVAGDPGSGDPPWRNAPAIMMFDVTKFPHEKARMVGFWWGYGNGSIRPFIDKFDEWSDAYRIPNNFRGYDSTSTQKAIAELAWNTGDNMVVPLSFDGAKKAAYINAAILLMSKNAVQIPAIKTIEDQMRGYQFQDKKLAQDIVCAFCMACYLMVPLYRDVYPEYEDQIDTTKNLAGAIADASGRYSRPESGRHFGRAR